MKKLILSFLAVSALVLGGMGLVANAAPTSTIVQNLQITALSGGGTLCLHILNSGLVQTTSGDCGSGSFTTTTINGTASLVFALKGDGSEVHSVKSRMCPRGYEQRAGVEGKDFNPDMIGGADPFI